MTKSKTLRISMFASLAAGVLVLSGCSIGYRCPLEPGEQGDYPTACSSMQDAMYGAARGTGGRTSVLMDDKGRLVPREMLEGRVAQPMANQNVEPYRGKSGEPVFHQPKVYQVWTGAFVDAEGNLHDGHTSWFSTPGRWAYGTVNQPGAASNVMSPSLPDTRPKGRVVHVDPRTGAVAPNAAAPQTPQDQNRAALQNLSNAANSAAVSAQARGQGRSSYVAPTAAPGVTAPAVGLVD